MTISIQSSKFGSVSIKSFRYVQLSDCRYFPFFYFFTIFEIKKILKFHFCEIILKKKTNKIIVHQSPSDQQLKDGLEHSKKLTTLVFGGHVNPEINRILKQY